MFENIMYMNKFYFFYTWFTHRYFVVVVVVVVVACVLQTKISNQSTKNNVTIITGLFINRGH